MSRTASEGLLSLAELATASAGAAPAVAPAAVTNHAADDDDDAAFKPAPPASMPRGAPNGVPAADSCVAIASHDILEARTRSLSFSSQILSA